MGGQGLRRETEIYLSAYLVPPRHTPGPLATAEGSAPHTPAQPEGMSPWQKGASKPLAWVTSQSGSCWAVTLQGQGRRSLLPFRCFDGTLHIKMGRKYKAML